jgi:hypothetical protein
MGIKDTFLKKITAVRAQMGDIAAMFREAKTRKEQILQEIDRNYSLPLPRADVLEIVNRTIDAGRQDYLERFGKMLESQILRQGLTQGPNGGLPLLAPWSGQGVHAIIPAAVFGLLGDQLKESLARVVADMPWPEAGLPLAERTAEIERLNKELSIVEAELAELQSAADAAGIVIQ